MKAEIDAKQLSFYFCQMPGQSVGGAPKERERERAQMGIPLIIWKGEKASGTDK